MRLRSLLAVLAALGMAACGGGGSDSSTDAPTPPGGSSNVSLRAATPSGAVPAGESTTIELTVANAGPDTADLRFEQHCEGFAPALHGAIHWSVN